QAVPKDQRIRRDRPGHSVDFVLAGIAAAADDRAGADNSWPRTEIIAARRLHRLKLFARERRRADDRHVATENIQKLRQALEHMKPALTARLRLREIVVCDPAFRLVLGHRRRNAQRITPERAAAIADALLRQKNLRTIAQL